MRKYIDTLKTGDVFLNQGGRYIYQGKQDANMGQYVAFSVSGLKWIEQYSNDHVEVTNHVIQKRPDFRKNGRQVIDVGDGTQCIWYVGKCPVSGVRLYKSNESNDPRGILGHHAATEFVASEYGMTGTTWNASWIACNNDSETYNQMLALAKLTWREL